MSPPRITRRLNPPPDWVPPMVATPEPKAMHDGCSVLRRLEIADDGEATDPRTGCRYDFNLRALSIVQELRIHADPIQLVSAYAALYRLTPGEAEREINAFLLELHDLGLFRGAFTGSVKPA